ncbi:MAG: hypothetical protein NT062_14885 [Proteobacteria bacterium]|nr:hypothetical protein [Pseudomonadota bacterium]
MSSTLVESFELLVAAEQLAPRLEAAAKALAQLPELAEEKAWLAAARARLATARVESHGALLDRALRLPELDGQKGERGKLLQGAIADETERLQGGITHVANARAPLLDVLFQNLKLPMLRKFGRAELERFCVELERRLTSGYAVRMFKGEPYSAVTPTVRALRTAIATWRSVFIEPPLDGEPATALRDELAAAGRGIERSVRQARLLAQAALLPTVELLDAAGVVMAKLKRRGKDVDDDTHPLLEHDPPDPLLPTADERAELVAAADA